MRIARRISQILFFVLYFVLFLSASYPLSNSVPVQSFLRMDSLSALTAAIAARTFASISITSLVILLISIIGGRFFCGWVCPLGSSIDWSDTTHQGKRQKKNNPNIRLHYLKFLILITILIAAVFSFQLSGYIAPISLFTRTVTTFIYPVFVFLIDHVIAFLYQFSSIENFVYLVDDALRGTLLPVMTSNFYGSLFNAAVFLAILAFGFFQRRVWCRNICPLGALLGVFSKFRFYRRIVSDACTECGLCARECRMGAIQANYHQTLQTECINCMDCQTKCPVHAISFGFVKKPMYVKTDIKRRQVIGAGITGLLGLATIRSTYQNRIRKGYTVRPPGALEEGPFLDLCIRCGECVRVCSTSGKGLQLAGLEDGWEGLLTPVLKTPAGYCEYNCNMCGQVCPTGAIQPLDLLTKQTMKMGTAHFDKTRCIPWYYGEDCLVCEEHCPISEKAIRFVETDVTTIDGKSNRVLLPYVDESACIGCGICTSVCPIEGHKGIFVTNANEQRYFG